MLAAHTIATYNSFSRYHNAGEQSDYVLQPTERHRHTSTTRYSSPSFEREISNGQTTDLTYIQSPSGLVAAIKTTGTQQDAMLIATDHLGSIIGVWNASGTLLEEHRYSAWGLRTSSTANPRLRRGFTGHEHLAQFGLIDMQARLYDPHLGRFLAPDPYVQAPDNHLSLNRYAYCMNNPLKYVDPTGEVSIVAVLIGAAIGGTINLIANSKKIDNVWEGIASFAVGAGAGALTALTGGSTSGFWASGWTGIAAAGVSSASVTATNNIVGQLDNEHGFGDINWSSVGHDALYAFGGGMAAYGASAMMGGVAEHSILKNTIKHIGSRFAYHMGGRIMTGENPFKNFTNHTLGLDASILLPLVMDGITYGVNKTNLPNKIMNKRHERDADFEADYEAIETVAGEWGRKTGESVSINDHGFTNSELNWNQGIPCFNGVRKYSLSTPESGIIKNYFIGGQYRPIGNVDLFLIYNLLLH